MAAITESGEGMRLVDLCHATGLQRPTVCRLLEPLLEEGYVQRHGRFRYLPGPQLARAGQWTPQPNVAARLRPVLESISAQCGDAVFLVVREGSQSNCIARHVGTYPVQVLLIQVGTMQPLGVGAAGLALLAALPDEEVSASIEDNSDVLSDYGGMTQQRLRMLVRATRERGWSVVGNHATLGVLGVGRVVRDSKKMPIAGISVASTIERMTRDRQKEIAQLIEASLKRSFPRGLR